MIQFHPSYTYCFVAATSTDLEGALTWGENVKLQTNLLLICRNKQLLGSELAPTGQWVFVGTGVDSVAGIHYGFRYHLNNGQPPHQYFGTRSASYYALDYPTTALNLGGITDPDYPDGGIDRAYAYLQYVRLYLDYTPKTEEEFIKVALMESAS